MTLAAVRLGSSPLQLKREEVRTKVAVQKVQKYFILPLLTSGDFFGDADMRTILTSVLLTGILAGVLVAQVPVREIAPHPLDGAFANRPDNSIVNGILNNPHFRKAIAEAQKTMREAEEAARKNPGLIGASPQRAARRRFLEVLTAEADQVNPIGAAPAK